MKLYHIFIEKDGTFHLRDNPDDLTCRCGKPADFLENHVRIPMTKRELCWPCHKDA